MNKSAICAIFWILLIAYSNAASPLFISAITSALATIPFSGGPMTTGLVGAKLGIGTKLLYYLGYFGRKAPSKPKKKPPASPKIPSFAESGFPSQSFQNMPSGFPNSFPPTSNFQNPFGGVDPSTLFQALTAQGVDPNVAIEAINYAGSANAGPNAFASNAAFGANAGPNAFASNAAFGGFGTSGSFGGGRPGFPAGAGFSPAMSPGGMGFPPNPSFQSAIPAQQFIPPQGGGGGGSFNQPIAPETPDSENESEDDAESFFTFLTDMDENTCISRLICDIGRSPSFLGEFSENISSMVSTLKVPPTSRAYKYIEIMEGGKKEGQCDTKFPECGDTSYEVVKNIAPSVSLPQNVNSADINF